MTVIDCVPAYSLEVGDLVNIEGDIVSILTIEDGEDIDEIVVEGESFETGDKVMYSLYADDEYDILGA